MSADRRLSGRKTRLGTRSYVAPGRTDPSGALGKPRVRANPRVDAGRLGPSEWLCTLGFVGNRDRVRPAGSYSGVGTAQDAATAGLAGSAGGRCA